MAARRGYVRGELAVSDCLSFGGGVNSVALAIWLIQRGWRGPIVFSDTGCEWPHTLCYMDYFETEYLRPHGLAITRLKGLLWQVKRGGISLIEYCETRNVIPLAAQRWCTVEWKVAPLQRWRAANSVETALIGISAEESHRRADAVRPLVDEGIDRAECTRIIERAGLSVPLKSGCYICPFQRDEQWHILWKEYPALFERAARLEEIAARKPGVSRWNVTFDPSGAVTLRQRQARYEAQLPMFDDATMDGLRAYQPCVCGI